MATAVLTDASFTIGGTDLSDHVQSITLNYEAEAKDDTAMGDSTRSNAGGLKAWNVDVTLFQDYAASETDATLFSSVGSLANFIGKASSEAVTATTPSFSGTALLQSYQPISGTVGDMHTITISLVSAGDLSRNTS
jgi:hypothetical protein